MAEESFQTGVVLGETERKIVEAKAEFLGLGSRGFSAALRIIIREWAELKNKNTVSMETVPPQKKE